MSVKTNPNSKVRYGWIVGIGDPVPHEEQPLNDTDSRRFTIEYRDTGKTSVVDARSLKIWHTDEIPIFRQLELEALNTERATGREREDSNTKSTEDTSQPGNPGNNITNRGCSTTTRGGRNPAAGVGAQGTSTGAKSTSQGTKSTSTGTSTRNRSDGQKKLLKLPQRQYHRRCQRRKKHKDQTQWTLSPSSARRIGTDVTLRDARKKPVGDCANGQDNGWDGKQGKRSPRSRP